MSRRSLLKLITAFASGIAFARQANEPKPPKTDLPYLLEAHKLIPTDIQTAARSKDGATITIPGTTATARTPLPEPIFLFSPEHINAEQFEMFHFQVTGGQREWKKGGEERPDNDAPEDTLRLTLRPVEQNVIRIEAAEMLDPGEYALIPRNANTAFCFTVF